MARLFRFAGDGLAGLHPAHSARKSPHDLSPASSRFRALSRCACGRPLGVLFRWAGLTSTSLYPLRSPAAPVTPCRTGAQAAQHIFPVDRRCRTSSIKASDSPDDLARFLRGSPGRAVAGYHRNPRNSRWRNGAPLPRSRAQAALASKVSVCRTLWHPPLPTAANSPGRSRRVPLMPSSLNTSAT